MRRPLGRKKKAVAPRKVLRESDSFSFRSVGLRTSQKQNYAL